MNVKQPLFLTLFFLAQVVSGPSHASDAYLKVDDNETGQGILRPRQNECLLITPSHVVENAFKIEVTTVDRSRRQAELVDVFPGDIAVVRLDKDTPVSCRGTLWPQHNRLTALLGTEKQGELHTMLADGSIRKTPVDVVGYDKYRHINVRPVNQDDTITKGMSGSTLYIGGQWAGMLVSVTDNIGNVLRQDALATALSLFFEDTESRGEPSPPEASATAQAPPQPPTAQEQELTGTVVLNSFQDHRVNLKENSPIRIHLLPTGDRVRYAIDVMDSTNRVSCRYSLGKPLGKEAVSFPCTPLKTDTFSFRVTGTEGEGRYKIRTTPIVTDAALRSEAHVLQIDGEEFSAVLVKNAIAEYKVRLYQNSPVRLNFSSLDENFQYTVELSDSSGKIVLRKQYRHGFDTQHVRLPFTPDKNDTYLLRVLGTGEEGKYTLTVQSIAFDAQLRGEANVLKIGDSGVSGAIAKDAVAEYRFELEEFVPVRLSFSATGDGGSYAVEIVDSRGTPVYRNPYKRIGGSETTVMPFTVAKTDTYTLRLVGAEGECGYSVAIAPKQ